MVTPYDETSKRVGYYQKRFGSKVTDNGMGGIYVPCKNYLTAGHVERGGCNINDTTDMGSPLHVAIGTMNINDFEFLLENGANPYAEDKNGFDVFDTLRTFQSLCKNNEEHRETTKNMSKLLLEAANQKRGYLTHSEINNTTSSPKSVIQSILNPNAKEFKPKSQIRR